jgi:hypothetical protein
MNFGIRESSNCEFNLKLYYINLQANEWLKAQIWVLQHCYSLLWPVKQNKAILADFKIGNCLE